RYADDLTFSFPVDDPQAIRHVIRMTMLAVASEGYTLHLHRKLQIRRRHDSQVVTGLVVNERVNLPRKLRRWLRAVEHRQKTGRAMTMTAAQLAGWRALVAMVSRDT